MASGRDGFGGGWRAIQSSIDCESAIGMRKCCATLSTGGRPRPLFLVAAIDATMN
jgi:hypothetical protein